MYFVTDDHRTVKLPKKSQSPRGVLPETIDPLLLATIQKSNVCSLKVKASHPKFSEK